ncbi:PPR containing plant protein [Heracleum sosnowskyi]|uniref:PPR containing plant protein n=1 Tax=Heracleum sosnowskyi TaxID=360622 RepID=A0AAD8JJ13_9APIA|nr:PPR containing plant protein [Heracleum sosnowskyi]
MIKKLSQSRSISSLIRVFQTDTARTLNTITPTKTPSSPGISLFSRIFKYPDPKVSIVPLLDQWVKEERSISVEELRKIIRQLRKFRRVKHALQISQWMNDKSFLDLTSSDVAIQLDLIAKVHGVEEAEKFFNDMPISSKDFRSYGALLVCYADAKLLEKAEAVMQSMKELNYMQTLSYNVMLKLYSHCAKLDKLDSLVQEMEDLDIKFSKFTYNTILNAYAEALDIDQLEKLLTKMEADPLVTMDWNAYVVAAKGYLRVRNKVKALESLQKSEQLVAVSSRKIAYELYMTMYARMGNKEEVHRIWKLYKSRCKFYNMGYLCMMSSLAKMDDLDAAQEVFDEWEVKKSTFDIQLPNFLISAYCKKGLMEKAESLCQRLLDNGNEPNGGTWTRVAFGYQKQKQMEKAVEALNKSILASEPGSKLYFPVLDACLIYLKEREDLDRIEHIKRLLAEQGHDYTHVFERLTMYSKEETNADFKAFELTEGDEHTLEKDLLEVGEEGRN